MGNRLGGRIVEVIGGPLFGEKVQSLKATTIVCVEHLNGLARMIRVMAIIAKDGFITVKKGFPRGVEVKKS